jgi:tetracycline 7-halogenase / FADH2 O2-dependent halogenase
VSAASPVFDVAVLGSGFAGSLTARLLRALGRSVLLVERGTHPRFAIGESSSPLANLLLESLCRRYGLTEILPLASFGSWQRRYPEVACGLKRGFTFYGHRFGQPFAAAPDRSDQLLVAASPSDEVADTHWYRSDVDHFLQRRAQDSGAEYVDRTEVEALSFDGAAWTLDARRADRSRSFRARLVVDGSGPAGCLHRALGLRAEDFPNLPATEGLYTHFTGVGRIDAMAFGAAEDRPPYPPDDAALHHVFPGGWIWVLRFGNGITSAGVAAVPELARELRLEEGAAAWDRLLGRLPTVREQFAKARAILPFVHRPRLPFRAAVASGPGWILLPSAAAFVDPILSTGFPLTLLGIERLVGAIERHWDTPELLAALAAGGERTLTEADTAARLVAALYARFHDFHAFAALTRLYFAAASYAEAARRLERTDLAGAFLSGNHPLFGDALRACCAAALDPAETREALRTRVGRAIEPLDVIGLSDETRRNWYPVEAGDLRAGAAKLHASPEEIDALIARMARPLDAEISSASASGSSSGAGAPRRAGRAAPPAPPR